MGVNLIQAGRIGWIGIVLLLWVALVAGGILQATL